MEYKLKNQFFLVCLVALTGLPHFYLVVGLTVGLSLDGAEFRDKDVAIGLSG